MVAGAAVLETPEPVADLVPPPSPNRTLDLPPEVWERVIGWIPFYLDPRWGFGSPSSRATLVSCTLVCRSWLHKSQRLLFPTVVLTDANKANSFLAALKTSPSLGQHVVTLHIGPLKQGSDGTSKTPNSCGWIYPILNTLPPLLHNVIELKFQNLPPMHKSFFVLAPKFKSVTALFLEGLANQSFSEIIRLVNHCPLLQRLKLNKCQWRQPAHFYSGIKHRLQKVEIWTDDNCKMNMPKWLSASHSTSALTRLCISDWVESALMAELNQVLKKCTNTLQVLRMDFKNDITLNLPALDPHTSLEFIHFWTLVEILAPLASQVSVPTSLSMFQLNFMNPFEQVFETQYQISWKTIDTRFSDSRLKNLSHFIIWTTSIKVDDFPKERISISKKFLPNLFKKDIIWWGDYNTYTGIDFFYQLQWGSKPFQCLLVSEGLLD